MNIQNNGIINGHITESNTFSERDAAKARAEAGRGTAGIVAGEHRIARGRKTDVVKIVSAMYDLHLFETPDGRIATNKQKLMDEVGQLFGEDLSQYSMLLSSAKSSKGNFLNVFDELKERAKQYFLR